MNKILITLFALLITTSALSKDTKKIDHNVCDDAIKISTGLNLIILMKNIINSMFYQNK
jgi:hypothetical protein